MPARATSDRRVTAVLLTALVVACGRDATEPDDRGSADLPPSIINVDSTGGLGGRTTIRIASTLQAFRNPWNTDPLIPTGIALPAGTPLRVRVHGEIVRTRTQAPDCPSSFGLSAGVVPIWGEPGLSDPEAPGEVYPTVVGLWGEELLPDRYYGYYQPVAPGNVLFEGAVPAGKEEFYVHANLVNCRTSTASGYEYAFIYQGAWTWTIEPINGAEENGGTPIVNVTSLANPPSGTISAQLTLGAGVSLSTVQWYFVPDTVREQSYLEGGTALRAALRTEGAAAVPEPRTRLELIRAFRSSRVLRASRGDRAPFMMALRAPPQPVAACAGLTSCDVSAPVPGAVLAVVTLTDGRTFADAARQTAAPPPVIVSCTPATLQRGQMVRCGARLSTPQAFTVIMRQALEPNLLVEDPSVVQYPAGAEAVWEGPAVATSEVRFTVVVTDQGQTDTLTSAPDTFTVTPRAWPAWAFQTRTAVYYELYGPKMQPYPKAVTAADSTVLGQFLREPMSTVTVTRPATGPNAGVAFIGSPYVVTEFQINIHPALNLAAYPPGSSGYAGAQQWVNDQNGLGSGTCTQSAIPLLRAEVERHEGGSTVAPNSHPGKANQVFAQHNPQNLIERLYTKESDSTLIAIAKSTEKAFFESATYRNPQQAFDAMDIPILLQSAGCAFDFNPNDN